MNYLAMLNRYPHQDANDQASPFWYGLLADNCPISKCIVALNCCVGAYRSIWVCRKCNNLQTQR